MNVRNLFARLLSRPATANRVRPSTRLGVEPLEDRLTPVVNPYDPNPIPAGFVTVDGVALDGVVQLNLGKPGDDGICSGSLLRSQRHILTAAHCLTDDNGMFDVTQVMLSFQPTGWANPITYTVAVTPQSVWTHPSWNGNISDGYDIAVIELPTLAPSGPAGLGVRGYTLYSGFDEETKQFEFAGYGKTGTGGSGARDGTQGTGLRLGYNRFDTRTNPVPLLSDTGLAFDFDNGGVANNTLAPWGSPRTPVKEKDSMIAKGDSGGPSFLNGAVAGVASGVYAVDPNGPNSDYGDIGVVERVSLHTGWLNGFLTARHDLVIDLTQQRPVDGQRDSIKLLREGTNVVFYVNDQFHHFVPLSQVRSITLNGSADGEDFLIDSDLNTVVRVNGNGGTDRLVARNAVAAHTVDVSADRLAVRRNLISQSVFFGGVEAVEVIGDSADTVNVNAVRTGAPVTVVNAGTVNVGARGTGSLGTITDAVTVNGNGSTTLSINDDGWTAPRTYALSQNQLVADNFTATWTTVSFSGLTVMELHGGSGGNTTTATTTPAAVTRLYTGGGVDTTNVRGTSGGVLAIEGEAGNDTVSLGMGGSVQSVLGSVRINNDGGFTTVNADNSSDATAKSVTMQTAANNYISVTGLTPGTVRVARSAVRRLNLWTGTGNDTFTINDTPDNFAPLSFGTSIRSGDGNDSFNVNGTSGWLAVETGGGNDNLVRVGNNANALNRIAGEVSVDGAGGLTGLLVNDASTAATPAAPSYEYIVDAAVVQRTDRAAIHYQNAANLSLFTSQATDFVTVRGTAPFAADSPGTVILTSGGDDFITIRGTSGYLRADLGSGKGAVYAGDAKSSLDAIRGSVDLTGAGFDVNISNAAATTWQMTDLTRSMLFGLPAETVRRYEMRDGVYVPLNTFNVGFLGGGTVTYSAGQGGDSLFATGTQANVSTTLIGHAAARDVLAVGFGSDTRQILGPVILQGQAEDNDVAYYYDYLNPTRQSYAFYGFQVGTHPNLYFTQQGIAPVDFIGFGGVSFYAPVVGKNSIDVLGTPDGTQLGIVAGNGDLITIGSNGSALGGTVDGIRGHVFIPVGNATVIVDDSGNNKTAREARLSTFDFLGTTYGQIDGLTPGGISFVDRPLWNVDVRLGGQNDYFLMSGDPLATRMSIDGGAGNDVLVGTGGNILRGGAGSDLLIAGATASFLYGDDLFTSVGAGQDVLIGGTTVHDTDRAKLGEIMAVWTSGAEYETRTATLRNDLLGADKVTGNGGGNILYGMWENDLFFLSVLLDDHDLYFYGLNPDEQFVPL